MYRFGYTMTGSPLCMFTHCHDQRAVSVLRPRTCDVGIAIWICDGRPCAHHPAAFPGTDLLFLLLPLPRRPEQLHQLGRRAVHIKVMPALLAHSHLLPVPDRVQVLLRLLPTPADNAAAAAATTAAAAAAAAAAATAGSGHRLLSPLAGAAGAGFHRRALAGRERDERPEPVAYAPPGTQSQDTSSYKKQLP